jgi:hypothetical protein
MVSEIAEAPPAPAVEAPEAAPAAALVERPAESTPKSTWIVGPVYDLVFFLLPPIMASLAGYYITGHVVDTEEFDFYGFEVTPANLFLGVFIHAHIIAVVFRSHANKTVLKRFPMRFLALPVLLYMALVSSIWCLIIASVLATFWDVYHSGAQTFGFARIYDAKQGNARDAGRRLDWWLNQILYAGPIIGGMTMMAHFESFSEFDEVGPIFFTKIPAFMESWQSYFTWAIVIGSVAYLIYYVKSYIRLAREGHKISKQKVFLLVTTNACTIWAWGFNPWGQAFFIVNVFHALQYFGLVWWSEKKTMMQTFGVEANRFGKPIALLMFVSLTCLYGLFVESSDASITTLWAITLTASLMHFYYDGFIWSVRKQHI